MYAIPVTYTDYNDVERSEKFYFNLTQAEIAEMELSTTGGFAESIQKIVDAKDTAEIIKVFKKLVLSAYGIKTEDGRGFRKSAMIRDEFECSAAYSEIFMKLATDADAASAFIKGIVPASVAKELDK